MTRALPGILKGGLQLSTARAIAAAIQGLQTFILAKLLGVTGFGTVNVFNLISLYGGLTGFGIDTVAVREIPGRAAAGDAERQELLKNLAFTYEIGLRILVCAIVAALGIVMFEERIRIGVLLVAANLLVDKICLLYYGIGTATKKFGVLSTGNVIGALTAGLLTILLVRVLDIYAQLAALLGVQMLMTLFYESRLKLSPRIHYDRREFIALVKMGIPFVALSLIYYCWRASDRMMIAVFMDVKMLGIYSFAALAVQLVVSLLNDFQTALQPFVFERTVRATTRTDFYALMRKPSVVFAYVTPVILAFLWLIYPHFVMLFVPEYEESIWIFRILVFQVYIGNIGMMVNYLLRAPEINKQSRIAWSYTAAALMSLGLIAWFLRSGFGLGAVASAVVGSHCVAVAINLLAAQKYYLEDWRSAIRYYGQLLAPAPAFALFCGAIWMIESGVSDSLLRTTASFVIFLVFASPVIYSMNEKVGLLAELAEIGLAMRKGNV